MARASLLRPGGRRLSLRRDWPVALTLAAGGSANRQTDIASRSRIQNAPGGPHGELGNAQIACVKKGGSGALLAKIKTVWRAAPRPSGGERGRFSANSWQGTDTSVWREVVGLWESWSGSKALCGPFPPPARGERGERGERGGRAQKAVSHVSRPRARPSMFCDWNNKNSSGFLPERASSPPSSGREREQLRQKRGLRASPGELAELAELLRTGVPPPHPHPQQSLSSRAQAGVLLRYS